MTDERTFGLSRWEKIRIEAARLSMDLMNQDVTSFKPRSADEIREELRSIADPIEAWLLQADADAEARIALKGASRLADSLIADAVEGAKACDAITISGMPEGFPQGEFRVVECTLAGAQFEWLAAHLAKRGFAEAPGMSRQDLIRAYYADVMPTVNGVKFPNFEDLSGDEWRPLMQSGLGGARQDDLAVGAGGRVHRFVERQNERSSMPTGRSIAIMDPRPGGSWVFIDELPGHRIENGRIMWSPGLWPPMETEG